MVLKILVTDPSGVEISADIAKDASFELVMEQPLLSTDRAPVPFSTQIYFPSSDTNKKLFGYIPAMMMEPSRKRLSARILVDGCEMVVGVLQYTGIQDGMLQYSGRYHSGKYGHSLLSLIGQREYQQFMTAA